ncbi:MAG: protein-L-isoaspartate(D-aspartate) O-methyltransferase [Candidatus Omnitrophica bacterium]|nr:protein-L-isoaspartate(D-aspartate) O-methyltransferase [Candidatus Omnitrophota bacterium]
MNYSELRKEMVETQLIPRGISDKRVLEAFLNVPRHAFVPDKEKENAYNDFPLPIGNAQTISQPYIVALMTESLGLSGTEKVLEIGTGSGYQTAILAEIVKEVYSIERIPALAEKAERLLKELGYLNIHIISTDGTLGWEEKAPFDRIIITAASSQIPEPLIKQLKDNGKLILPLGTSLSQILTLVEKKKESIETLQICGCTFVPLIGKYGITTQ